MKDKMKDEEKVETKKEQKKEKALQESDILNQGKILADSFDSQP